MDNSQPSLVAATATAPAQSIFDEIGRIRVIAAQDFDASDRLRDEGKAFVARKSSQVEESMTNWFRYWTVDGSSRRLFELISTTI
jgi:hypothetical protein